MHDSHPTLIFLCGDVMTGRGIDQALPFPGDWEIYESYLRDARDYILLAERAHGPIPRPLAFETLWGEALQEFDRRRPQVRIVNLETSITESRDYWKGKGINYKMNPRNTPVLTAARIDACALANNHVMDWGYSSLADTISSLQNASIGISGAGVNFDEASCPAIIDKEGVRRVLLFSCGFLSSGIPVAWQATATRAGVFLAGEPSGNTIAIIQERIQTSRRPGDIVIVSVHWGDNWGYGIPSEQIDFAHELIDNAGVDIVHGHSSHHAKAIEIYNEKPVFYGCGDFINDYEGIGGKEEFRGDLALMYFVSFGEEKARSVDIELVSLQMRRFSLQPVDGADGILWLAAMLRREGKRFGTGIEVVENNRLRVICEF